MVRSHLEFVQQSIDSLDSKLDELIAPYENDVSLLCTIPRVYLKPTLVQCAHTVVKSTTTPYYRNKCKRLAKRKYFS